MTQLEEHTRWIIRRSKLVVTPDDLAGVDAAVASGADAVVVDLSQTTPSQKEAARRMAAQALSRLSGHGMDLLVWADAATVADDATACAGPGLTGVLVSADTEEDVWRVDNALAAQETAQGIPVGTFQMELVAASPRAVLDIFDIAKASPRITCLSMNTASLTAAMGVEESEEVDQLMYARGRLLVAARLYGMEAHALAFVPRSSNGQRPSIEERAVLANKMGYRGAFCWDAKDVTALNKAFAPSQEELEYAQEAKAAMEEAISQGKGAAVLRSGTILDMAMLRHSDLMLSWAAAIKRRDQAKAAGGHA